MAQKPLLLLTILALLFAGCSGGGGDAGLPQDTGTPTDGASPSPGGSDDDDTDPDDPTPGVECASDDPKFHTHDYWGLRTDYVLFEDTLTLAQDATKETETTADGTIIGKKVFNTETDGDDDQALDKTDIVYQGTKEIAVILDWDAATVPGVAFAFKHASTPEFSPLIPTQSGQEFTIKLQSRWADMAHQDSVSRWSFQVVAYDQQQSASPYPVHAARGDVTVFMEIRKGDGASIDPPHPPFYCGTDVLYGGEINATVSNAAMVTVSAGDVHNQVAAGSELEDFAPSAPHVVPTETTLLRAWLHYNYTGPAADQQHTLGLKFHGADTVEYQFPDPADTDAGYAYYEIPVDGMMTDSPYAFQTDWRYGVYPILNGQAQQGDFQGDFHIVLQTLKV